MKLLAVVDGLLEKGFEDIILVNDGSRPENRHYFNELLKAHPAEVHLLKHEKNLGKGAALKTAFKYVPIETLPALTGLEGDRFEYEANVLLGVKNLGFAIDEVKIRTLYPDDNTSAHFRTIPDLLRICSLLLKRLVLFTASSLICAGVDIAIFTALSFSLNKRYVFHSSGSIRKSLIKYYSLAVFILAAQTFLTEGAFSLLHIDIASTAMRTVVYTAVMLLLFLVSYRIQQKWVFAERKGIGNDSE